ncbi:4-hydroxy-3-methylbut-2-enyl diphosphate reductase [Rariglobus hedericola]|uniref:4-hydroxy-3-methylbut-2-enyl diphosphate reductase n=1 Tax=Rariglobus hedericola TaxID=2597822 RepID=A0A556QSV4_9BACT|nr:4-hydroxy-3-methylbut-2-enyl diphosphate reductase [Rariglobus hedericola]
MSPSSSKACVILAFNASNQLLVRKHEGAGFDLAFTGPDTSKALAQLDAVFPAHTGLAEYFHAEINQTRHRVVFTQISGRPSDPSLQFQSIEQLEAHTATLGAGLRTVLAAIDPYLIHIPYLQLGENDFIYKFRPEKDRNLALYSQDADTSALYQSALCSAIKAIARRREGVATAPIPLDFGAVRYLIPSHFGFCLGVKNAIDRAYETLAANPGRRVFMLSELIHNPFVNEDLLRRGLRYLQSEKGVPFAVNGQKATAAPFLPLLWDTLTSDDVVIIPAFGATDEDKKRLVRKGIAVCQYDATCMLVEKVWKAARTYGREGYTVVIHGKHEHEETKATFSNTRRYAPAVIVRNLAETQLLGEVITQSLTDPAGAQTRFESVFADRHTPGFAVARDLARVAVVNQTTLLMNETREIIAHLRELYANIFGPDVAGEPARVGGSGRNDTLCYATQVNQDALARALEEPLDAAFIIGGKNSSNTYQLYRLCAQKLGDKAFFIQSETNIRSLSEVEHYVFPAAGPAHGGHVEVNSLWPEASSGQGPRHILITGGASCPDGVIQQVITRINSLFPASEIRSIADVQAGIEAFAIKA